MKRPPRPAALAFAGLGLLGAAAGGGQELPVLGVTTELAEPSAAEPRLVLRGVDFSESLNGHNEVVFHYAALSFADDGRGGARLRRDGRLRYRTRLVGYDTAWSEPTAEVKIRYTNLPAYLFARTYTFEVTASADGFNWLREPLRHRLRVRPPWWLTWWAGLLYAAVFVASIHLSNARRTAGLRQRARDLEELFSKRTAAVRAHARELETLDQIVQTINREVTLEDVMETLLEQGLKLVPEAERGSFSIFDREHDHFEIVSTSGWGTEALTGVTLSVEESMRRYSREAERLDEGIFLVRDPGARPGAEKLGHLPRAEALLSIEVTLGEKVEGYLVFDVFTSSGVLERLDVRTLKRYREHAISALTKARIFAELEKKSREAEQASRAKSSFLANMSHELRTPLNSIIGFSEILLTRLQDGEPRHLKFLSNIHASGQHLLSLINDILDLSKIEAGRSELVLEEVALDSVVEGVVSMMKSLAFRRGIALETEIPRGVPPILTDGIKLKQILYNLVSNAVKFSPEGGPVTVAVGFHEAGAPRNPLASEAVELAVADRGIGIHEDDQVRIFEEFRQVSSSMAREFPGTGLGLTLVRRYVELLDGSVTVESVPGVGSTFRVLLPTRFDQLLKKKRSRTTEGNRDDVD